MYKVFMSKTNYMGDYNRTEFGPYDTLGEASDAMAHMWAKDFDDLTGHGDPEKALNDEGIRRLWRHSRCGRATAYLSTNEYPFRRYYVGVVPPTAEEMEPLRAMIAQDDLDLIKEVFGQPYMVLDVADGWTTDVYAVYRDGDTYTVRITELEEDSFSLTLPISSHVDDFGNVSTIIRSIVAVWVEGDEGDRVWMDYYRSLRAMPGDQDICE